MAVFLRIDEYFTKIIDELHPRHAVQNFKQLRVELENMVTTMEVYASSHTSNIIEDVAAKEYYGNNDDAIKNYEDILNRMLTDILYSDDYADGTFCKKTSPTWEHIQTSYILLILDNLHITVSSWGGNESPRSIDLIIDGLIKGKRQNGWGEDFYDTCMTLYVLLRYQNTYLVSNERKAVIQSAISLVIDEINSDFRNQKGKEWYGAGFFGVALLLLNKHFRILTNEYGFKSETIEKAINQILQKSLEYYCEDQDGGYFKSDSISEPTTPDVWHTAEMILGLKQIGDPLRLDEAFNNVLRSAVSWIKVQSSNKGIWCADMGSRMSFIVTGRVFHALAVADPQYCITAMTKFVKILETHGEHARGLETGLITDLPVTINILVGISAMENVGRKQTQNQMQSAMLSTELYNIQCKLTQLSGNIGVFEKKYKNLKEWYILIALAIVLLILLSLNISWA